MLKIKIDEISKLFEAISEKSPLYAPIIDKGIAD